MLKKIKIALFATVLASTFSVFAESTVAFTAVTGLPTQVGVGQIVALHYQLQNIHGADRTYYVLQMAQLPEVTITSTTCNDTGTAAGELTPNASCDIYLNFNTATLPQGPYSKNAAQAQGVGKNWVYLNLQTTIGNMPPPPPPSTVTVNVSVNDQSVAPGTKLGTLTLLNGSVKIQQPLIFGDNTPFSVPVGNNYTYEAPNYVTSGNETLCPRLTTPTVTNPAPDGSSFPIVSDPTEVIIDYDSENCPVKPVAATVTMTGDLSHVSPVTPVNLTLTNTASQQTYTGVVQSNAQDQTFMTMLPGSYNAPATITVNSKTYNLTPAGSVTVSAAESNIALAYDSSTPTPPAPTGVMFSPYVDMGGSLTGSISESIVDWSSAVPQPTGLLKMVRDSGIKSIHAAFIVNEAPQGKSPARPCVPSWAGAPSMDVSVGYATPVFKQLHAEGVQYVISFGGENGNYLAQSCKDVPSLVAAYEQVISAYQPDGINFDFEGSFPDDKTDVAKAMAALEVIHSRHPSLPISFTLAVMPTGLTDALSTVQLAYAALGNNFSVDLMVMDYGSSFYPGEMGNLAIAAAKATKAQLEKVGMTNVQIGLIPMIGTNDSPWANYYLDFTIADAQALVAFAKQNSWINLLSMWSLNRDAPCTTSTYVQLYCSGAVSYGSTTPNEVSNYAYSQAFMNVQS